MPEQNLYDDEAFFEYFLKNRSSGVNFNDCIETPILFKMLPDLKGKRILDIGCGMGQHAKQYADSGAERVLGIDISEKMLRYAAEHFSAGNIEYRRLAMEDIGTLSEKFDLVTSSLAFDYAEDFEKLARDVYALIKDGGSFVFSMSHPMVTAWDGAYDRYTRTPQGERLYANVRNYCLEGLRKVDWVVSGYVCRHRMVSTLINSLIRAGFIIMECREAQLSDEMREKYPALFGGTIHRPEFIFFRCGKSGGQSLAGAIEQIRGYCLAGGREKTLRHAEAVARTAAYLAGIHGLDASKAVLAGMLHDISAVLAPREMLDTAVSRGMPLDPAEEKYPFLLHQRISALIAEETFSVTDREVLSAVGCHTTLRKNALGLDKAVFIADKISWDQEGAPPYHDELMRLAEESLDEACRFYIEYQFAHGAILMPHRWLTEALEDLRKGTGAAR